MNQDFEDMLRALVHCNVRFLVVGAHALAAHGVPRSTGDLDIWVEPSPENAQRIWKALEEFGAPVENLGVTSADFTAADMVVQLGLPPGRIDLLTGLSGLTFEDAWRDRMSQNIAQVAVPFLGRAAFIANKRATGRLKDLADLEALGEIPEDS